MKGNKFNKFCWALLSFSVQKRPGPLGPKRPFKKAPKKVLCVAEIRFGQPRRISNTVFHATKVLKSNDLTTWSSVLAVTLADF